MAATAMNQQHDAQLIALITRVGQHDPLALRELYDLTSGKLYGLALRVVHTREHAEDVIQETYLNIWRIAADYRSPLSPPMAWMGVIVRSRSLDFLRRRASQQVDISEELDAVINDTIASDSINPLDEAQASEQAWALHQCLSQLENKQREVVSLAYLRDLSHSELAEQLNLPLGTIKTWIRRGIEQMRICMARFA